MRCFPRLQERRHQPAGTLSGGEQQMCAIARALMSGPKLAACSTSPLPASRRWSCSRSRARAAHLRAGLHRPYRRAGTIRQVLKVVNRAYLLDAGRIRRSGSGRPELMSAEGAGNTERRYLGPVSEIFDIFLLETVLNRPLLAAGLLAAPLARASNLGFRRD